MDGFEGRLAAVAGAQGGVVTRAQALAGGYNDRDLRCGLRSGRLRRVRRGAYADARAYDALDDAGRHLTHLRAVHLQLEGRVVFSHASAATLHGLPLWNVDLTRVHVTRLGGSTGRSDADVVHHVGDLPDDDVTVVDGLPTVRPARAVVEVASIVGFEAGVVVADAALHARLVTVDELQEMQERCRAWPGSRRISAVVGFADGRSESVGESRARVLFHHGGLPAPELQWPIYDRAGQFVGRVDFYWPESRTAGEFDGELKFVSGDAKILFDEKIREDAIRELGHGVVRMIWADFNRPDSAVARFRRAIKTPLTPTP